MDVKISGEPKEIAALVVELQGRLFSEINYVIPDHLCSEKIEGTFMTEFQKRIQTHLSRPDTGTGDQNLRQNKF